MTTLIALYAGDGCIGRCDAKCYNAWGPECHCICQGGNHGAGKQEATASTRELPASWYEQAEAAGQIISVLGPSAMPATVPQDGGHDLSRPPCRTPVRRQEAVDTETALPSAPTAAASPQATSKPSRP